MSVRLCEHFAGKLNIPDFIHNPTEAYLNYRSSSPEPFEKGLSPIIMVLQKVEFIMF